VWDDNLAAFADAWATQLANAGAFEHRPNNQYGENIWTGSAGFFPIADVTNGWGNEVNDYNLATNTCNPGAVCGHFTQVVWWGTTRVGCGKATGPTSATATAPACAARSACTRISPNTCRSSR